MKYAWINEKGGTLKTTLATHSAVYLAAFRGEKTLLIDMDPQGQAGKALGVVPEPGDVTIGDVLVGEATIADAAVSHAIDGLDIVPSNKALADIPGVLYSSDDANERLKKALAGQRKYKHIVVDSPPSIGLLTRNILTATEAVCVPVNLSYFSLDGVAEMVRTINESRQMLDNKKLHLHKVIPTLYRRTKLADAVLGSLRNHFADTCATDPIGISVHIDEAQSWAQPVWQYRPKSRGSQMLYGLCEEVFGAPNQDGYALLKAIKHAA